jgi:dihydroorotate dehydrogenase (fumarate)
MDLSTTYLGLQLPHPLMPGASPLVDDLDMVKRLEDAGAAAIVMHSLFEEQITCEQARTAYDFESHAESFAEATSYFPCRNHFALGPDQYLEQIRRIKDSVSVPVIGSLNGATATGWLDYARRIQQAGADALELNLYVIAADPTESGEAVERRALEIVRTVKQAVTIPVAVKLSPFFCSFAHFAYRLDELGADGLVLFNRFYQPDLDLENLEVVPKLSLSDSSELLLRLRWTAILSGHLRASLAVTGGVHTAIDVIKAIMTGAHAIQLVSALLQQGPEYLKTVRTEMVRWMEEHEYASLRQMQGSMNLTRCPDPAAFERANYMRVLQSWRP